MATIKEKIKDKWDSVNEWIEDNPATVDNIIIGTMYAVEFGYVMYILGMCKGVKKSFNCMMDSVDNAIEQGALETQFVGEKKAERFLNDVLLFAPDKKHKRRKW